MLAAYCAFAECLAALRCWRVLATVAALTHGLRSVLVSAALLAVDLLCVVVVAAERAATEHVSCVLRLRRVLGRLALLALLATVAALTHGLCSVLVSAALLAVDLLCVVVVAAKRAATEHV